MDQDQRAAAPSRVPPGPELVPVVVRVPADKDYVVLIRSAASHLGARAGFTMAEITDLRLAVDEACGLLLLPVEAGGVAVGGDEIECRFAVVGGALHISITARTASPASPDTDSFGWNILAALVDELTWHHDDGVARVDLYKHPAARES